MKCCSSLKKNLKIKIKCLYCVFRVQKEAEDHLDGDRRGRQRNKYTYIAESTLSSLRPIFIVSYLAVFFTLTHTVTEQDRTNQVSASFF